MDFDQPDNSSKPKRDSRENTKEEKRKQRKAWKKRKRVLKRANSSFLEPSPREAYVKRLKSTKQDEREAETNYNVGNGSSMELTASKNSKKVGTSVVINANVDKKVVKTPCHSRGALMVNLSRGLTHHAGQRQEDVRAAVTSARFPQTTGKRYLHGIENPHLQVPKKKRQPDLKELNPDNIKYSDKDPVGSGSYGECFHAHYRGIDVLLKRMKHNGTAEDKERAKRDLIHEAEVISALGDHRGLPMIVGVVTNKEPICLVTQFHGVKDSSVTLFQAANSNLLKPQSSSDLFIEICYALQHVHSKGFLHNDIKANNVVLECNSSADKYTPVLIDFGKSTKKGTGSYRRKGTADGRGRSYLAPEVLEKGNHSEASDVYSIGRMLKVISSAVGFYPRVRALVKEATSETPELRPLLHQIITKLESIKF